MNKKSLLLLITVLLLMTTACSKYQKLLKSTDNEAKYNKAIEYFESGDYYRAIQLFDQLQAFYRGTDRAERIGYYYAYANYKQKDYILASYYFKQFARNFPKSSNAEEAAYLSAYCNYLESPPASLDQQVTLDAIQDLQLFANQYPNSKRVADANKLIDELRLKLETKAYEIAEMYFNMEDYKAAVINYQNLIKDYPDTQYREQAMYRIARSYYYYAEKSIASKKDERYQLTIDAVNNYKANFPQSKRVNELNAIQLNAEKQLSNFSYNK